MKTELYNYTINNDGWILENHAPDSPQIAGQIRLNVDTRHCEMELRKPIKLTLENLMGLTIKAIQLDSSKLMLVERSPNLQSICVHRKNTQERCDDCKDAENQINFEKTS